MKVLLVSRVVGSRTGMSKVSRDIIKGSPGQIAARLRETKSYGRDTLQELGMDARKKLVLDGGYDSDTMGETFIESLNNLSQA